MRCFKYKYMSLMLMFSALASCVDNYDVIPEGYSDPMLVVDGNIYSNQVCEFTLHHTVVLNGSYMEAIEAVDGATLKVCGSQGECYESTSRSASGSYLVTVGTLSSDTEYWLEVSAPGYGDFKSEPMKPLDAPAIENLTYKLPATSEGDIEFLVSTGDLSTGVPGEKSFVMWRYEECYELNTPVNAIYTYDPKEDAIVPLTQKVNHGWRETKPIARIVASNEAFNYGAITNYCVCQASNQSYRFMLRYRIEVFQECIGEAEYEYRHLLETQTAQMGGLFTPMPSELPSNVHGTHGEKCVGYVGVRGSIASRYIYVNRKESGYHYSPKFSTYETYESMYRMYKDGYKVYYYSPMDGPSSLTWSLPWVVDITDPYWGNVSLTAPDYWENAEEC